MDVYGDSAVFGKQVGGDILANKKTFLLLQALNDANSDQKATINKWLENNDVNFSQEKVMEITKVFNELNIKEKADALMEDYYIKAIESLNKITLDTEKKEYLKGFADTLMERIY